MIREPRIRSGFPGFAEAHPGLRRARYNERDTTSGLGGSWRPPTRTGRPRLQTSGLPVIGVEIFDDRLRIVGVDRRPEDLDHLGDAAVPTVAIEERRIHQDVVEAVARAAIGLDLRAPRTIL